MNLTPLTSKQLQGLEDGAKLIAISIDQSKVDEYDSDTSAFSDLPKKLFCRLDKYTSYFKLHVYGDTKEPRLGVFVFKNYSVGKSKIYILEEFEEHEQEAAKTENLQAVKKLNIKSLDKLIITDDNKSEIIAVLKQQANKSKIFDEWGLGEAIPYGQGMHFLFHGPPGTGKTWAAHCIAGAMKCDLLIISASQIQSSEPGGANRNIEDAFKKAKTENKILFLDECDSLITQRNNVGMILGSEINTLLTEVEKFDGIMIMATNRIDTLDEALERRLTLILEFPNPGYHERLNIWNALIPSKMPLSGVKMDELASFALSGGQIKNAILQAARLAAGAGDSAVTHDHFTTAIKRIISSKQLMGKPRQIRYATSYETEKVKSS